MPKKSLKKRHSYSKSLRNLQTEDIDALKRISSAVSESRTVIAVAGVLFGFLLNVSTNIQASDTLEEVLLVSSLILSMLTVILFSMPVIYHHLEFPYKNPRKFIKRYHWFMMIGFIPFLLSLFTASTFAMYQFIGYFAILVSLSVYAFAWLIDVLRKNFS